MNKGVQFDDVDLRGQIVGSCYVVGNLYYQTRPQGRNIYALSESDLAAMASARIKAMRAEFGEAFSMIYPRNEWTLRIFQ